MLEANEIIRTVLHSTDAEKVFTYPGSPPEKLYVEIEEQGIELVQTVREQHLLHLAQTRYYKELENGNEEIPVVVVSGEMGEAMMSQPLLAGSISAPILILVAEPVFPHKGNALNIAHQSSRSKTQEKIDNQKALAYHDNVKERILLREDTDTEKIGELVQKIKQEQDVGIIHIPKYAYQKTDESVKKCMMPEPEKIGLEEVKEDLNNASKPVFVVGRGCKHVDTRQKIKEAARNNGAVITTTWQMDSYFEDNYAGTIGLAGTPSANEAVFQSDNIIALGTSLQNLLTSFDPETIERIKQKTTQVEVNPRRRSMFASKWAETKVDQVIKAISSLEGEKWFEERYGNEELINYIPEPVKVLGETIREEYPNKVVNLGVGNSTIWIPHVLGPEIRKETSRTGSMGELAAGINREEEPLLVLGDGELEMDISLITEAQYQDTAATIIVVNNRRLGLVIERQEKSQGEKITPKKNPINYESLGSAFKGVESHTPRGKKEIRNTLRDCIGSGRIDIVEIKVEEKMSESIADLKGLPRLKNPD